MYCNVFALEARTEQTLANYLPAEISRYKLLKKVLGDRYGEVKLSGFVPPIIFSLNGLVSKDRTYLNQEKSLLFKSTIEAGMNSIVVGSIVNGVEHKIEITFSVPSDSYNYIFATSNNREIIIGVVNLIELKLVTKNKIIL